MDESFTGQDDIIKFNIGGTLFQTLRKTLTTDPNCRLAKPDFLRPHYLAKADEYFFDRNPLIFGAVLNYLRTKELHLSANICSAVAEPELEYWGLKTEKIERCCWTNYNEWRAQVSAMMRLEKNMKNYKGDLYTKTGESFWTRLQPKVWRFMNHPESSVPAKILEVTSFILVLLSLFSFVAATIDPFKRMDGPPIRTNKTTTTIATTSIPTTGSINANDAKEPANVHVIANLSLMSKHPALNIIDVISLVYFTLEYIFRFVFASNRKKYTFSLLAVIDLVALVPDFLDLVILLAGSEVEARVIHYGNAIRVLRALRIFRLVRHNIGLWVLVYTLKASMKELILLLWFLGIGTILFASLIYFAENSEQFGSIPESVWWALITMTTVGYGDFYPVSPWGKVVGSLCAMSGLLLLGFTIPILVNNFVLFYNQIKSVNDFERREGVTHHMMTRL